MPEETKRAKISQRRSLVLAYIDTCRGSVPIRDFISEHTTEDIEFEDFITR